MKGDSSKYAIVLKVTHKNLQCMSNSQCRRFAEAMKQMWKVLGENSTTPTRRHKEERVDLKGHEL